jgi:hypothetical protein
MLHVPSPFDDWTDVAAVSCDSDGCTEVFVWSNADLARLVAQCDNGWSWSARNGDLTVMRDWCPTHRPY